MSILLDAVRSGFYAQNQIHSRSTLISWSHRGRFATGLRLARDVAGAKTLDYGCGDGTFLGLLADGQSAPRLAVGAELYQSIVDECRGRFGAQKGLHFILIDDLDRPAHQGTYDAIFCMEVFEHVIDPVPLLDQFTRLLAPGGTLVISVPIETGIPVVVKQIVRRVAGWRGVGHYPGTTGYTVLEMLRSVLARSTQHITRPVITRDDGTTFHDHKGFNWRVLRGLVTERFELTRESTSPVEWLGPQLGYSALADRPQATRMKLPRVAIVSDLREERWHSMDLVAEMLLLNLNAPDLRLVEPAELRPSMVRRLSRVPLAGRTGFAGTADRILNRVWDYPRWLAARREDFDVFHVVDHSYAHLVTGLPRGRAVVTCHDLDAFQGVLPGSRGGTLVSRALGRHLLEGLQAAARIVCVSQARRDELVSYNVVPASIITVIPNGVHPTCSYRSDARADREVADLLGPEDSNVVELLHVGSTIPRKRIDVLLETVAGLRRRRKGVRLIRIGDTFTAAQQRQIRRLGLGDAVTVLPFVDRRVLAAAYRRATLVLQPSEREGFGLPVAEAMACGTQVVASYISAMVEVGGQAATYCPVGDVAAWVSAVSDLLDERVEAPGDWTARCAAGLAQSRRFSWRHHARHMTELYRDLLPHLVRRNVSELVAASQ